MRFSPILVHQPIVVIYPLRVYFVKIYEKIHFMRQLQGWSQEEMADKLSMSVNGYAKIERGKQIYKYLGLNKSLKHLG